MDTFNATRNQSPWDWLNKVFSYTPKRQPPPGAAHYAIRATFSLPGESVAGAGTVFGGGSSGPLSVISQTPQMQFSQGQVADGVQGVTYGGVQPQGLVDMDKLVSAQAA